MTVVYSSIPFFIILIIIKGLSPLASSSLLSPHRFLILLSLLPLPLQLTLTLTLNFAYIPLIT